MASVPKKIANKAGNTATATSLTGFLNMADEKYLFMPAGGHNKPISMAARKMMPK